jgi:FixJ family two-component response regulator
VLANIVWNAVPDAIRLGLLVATEGVIRSLGYAVATYASAEDFLGSNRVNDTSCPITDVHLPGLSGVELYRRLLDNGFAAPTIFVSGLA